MWLLAIITFRDPISWKVKDVIQMFLWAMPIQEFFSILFTLATSQSVKIEMLPNYGTQQRYLLLPVSSSLMKSSLALLIE